nr:hypothetical protein [Bifidobacterium catenulatum]
MADSDDGPDLFPMGFRPIQWTQHDQGRGRQPGRLLVHEMTRIGER